MRHSSCVSRLPTASEMPCCLSYRSQCAAGSPSETGFIPRVHNALSMSARPENVYIMLYLEATILTLLKYDAPIYSRLRNGLTREARVEKPWVLA